MIFYWQGKELSALIANNSCGALIAGEAQESDEGECFAKCYFCFK